MVSDTIRQREIMSFSGEVCLRWRRRLYRKPSRCQNQTRPLAVLYASRLCGAAHRTMLRIAGRTLHRARDTSFPQARVARQLPLQRSPVMIPLHRPAPALPESRPLPLAEEAPMVIRTETLPLPLMPPVTLPPLADETRWPATEKDTVLEAWQLPAWGVNVTFQLPSKDPAPAILASATPGAAIAERTVAANIQRGARKSAKKSNCRANIIVSPVLRLLHRWLQVVVGQSGSTVRRHR